MPRVYETGRGILTRHQDVKKEVAFPWSDFFLSASGISGMSASVAVGALSGSTLTAMRMLNTANTCALWSVRPLPLDAAPSGSGLLLVDWIDPTTADAVAAIDASVFLIPSDVTIAGASVLAVVSTCVTGGDAASDFSSTSLVAVPAPAAGASRLSVAVKYIHQAGDGDDDSGSNFHLMQFRYQYAADKLGAS